jgi:hypothetical protein
MGMKKLFAVLIVTGLACGTGQASADLDNKTLATLCSGGGTPDIIKTNRASCHAYFIGYQEGMYAYYASLHSSHPICLRTDQLIGPRNTEEMYLEFLKQRPTMTDSDASGTIAVMLALKYQCKK